MRPLVIFLIVAGIGSITWLVLDRPAKNSDTPKQKTIAVSRHGAPFTNSVSNTMDDYSKLTELFVNWDSAAAQATAATLQKDVASIILEELKKDSSAIYETALSITDNIKTDLQTIVSEKGIRQQREAFNSLTDNLSQFMNTVKYDKEKLYLQECPMAFDDTKPGHWLSRDEVIRNPYMGLHHPTYGKGMLICGETKTTINHTSEK